jgi:hypothetical protein
MPTIEPWPDWKNLDVFDLRCCGDVWDFIEPNPQEGDVLWLPFDAKYLIPENGMAICGADACSDACTDKPIPSDLVSFPEGNCPMCGEQGHDINDPGCKNPLVAIRSAFYGCRRCYDEQYTGLANRYLYDMCRLMGLEFDWLA